MSPFLEALAFVLLVFGGAWVARLLSTRGVRARQAKNAENVAEAARYTCAAHGHYTALTAVEPDDTGNTCPFCRFKRLLDARSSTNPK